MSGVVNVWGGERLGGERLTIIFGCIFGLEALYCQKFMKKLKIVFLPLATNSAEIVERVRGIMAAIPTSLIIESCVFLLVSCTISELAKK